MFNWKNIKVEKFIIDNNIHKNNKFIYTWNNKELKKKLKETIKFYNLKFIFQPSNNNDFKTKVC